SLAKLHHQPYGVLVKGILIFPITFASRSVFTALSLFLRSLQELLFVFCRALRPPELDYRSDFFFCHKGRMQALHTGGARRELKHVAASQEGFRTVGVQNGARVYLGSDPEGHTCREVSLD